MAIWPVTGQGFQTLNDWQSGIFNNLDKYSFFNRVVDEWNGLPNHIRESNSIATFKRNVLSFIKDN